MFLPLMITWTPLPPLLVLMAARPALNFLQGKHTRKNTKDGR